MPEFEYEFTKNEDWHVWDYGEVEATVIDLGETREGISKWEDSDIYYHWWIYEYECPTPGTDEKQKFTGKIKFAASGYGSWFINKANPAQHSRMNDFD